MTIYTQKWYCVVSTDYGWERIEDEFPVRMNRNDVKRAFEGRYNSLIDHVNPSPKGD
tara:strand:- start:339 stop:509 length:171 start_codon:yes stop_codon:yes gene_type:complete